MTAKAVATYASRPAAEAPRSLSSPAAAAAAPLESHIPASASATRSSDRRGDGERGAAVGRAPPQPRRRLPRQRLQGVVEHEDDREEGEVFSAPRSFVFFFLFLQRQRLDPGRERRFGRQCSRSSRSALQRGRDRGAGGPPALVLHRGQQPASAPSRGRRMKR